MNFKKDIRHSIQKTVFILHLGFISLITSAFVAPPDTTTIDSLTTMAYNLARKNQGESIKLATRALILSKPSEYKKGIADANLALGAAYLAKYNPGDSATFYYHNALELYSLLNNFTGLGRACYGLSYVYSFKNNAEKAEEFGARSVEYFRKAGKEKEEIAALGAVIYLAKQKGDYEKALKLSEQAIQTARLAKDTTQWADALNNKGNVLKDMFLFNPAIDAYFEAFRLWQFKNDSAGLAIAFGSIANAYFYEGDYKKSLEYNFKKLPLSKKAGTLWETNKTLNNIALSYNQLNQPDSALYYTKQSLAQAKQMNYQEGIANCYDKLSSVFLRLGKIDSSLWYCNKAVLLAEKINSVNSAAFLLSKAKIYYQKKNYSTALTTAKKAYQLAREKNDNHSLRDISFLLSEIYYHLGKRALAYPFLTEYLKLNDSISNMEYMRKVTRLDIQHKYEQQQKAAEFEIEKNRQQIELLKKTNQIKTQRLKIFWIIFTSLVLLSMAGALISFLVVRNKNHRIEQMKLEIRNYLLQAKAMEETKTKTKEETKVVDTLVKDFGLTQREAEIMEQIATGISNEKIAEKLFVSKNTVKFHIKNIFIKLDVRNRVEALHKTAI